MSNKTPEDTLRDAHLKATIWKNESEKGAYYNTEFARSYQDEKGNYHDTHSFSRNDLLRVAELARGAYGRINDLQRGQAQSTLQEKLNTRDNSDSERNAVRDERQAQPEQARPQQTYQR